MKQLDVKKIGDEYCDWFDSQNKPIPEKRFSNLLSVMYDFNRLISDTTENGSLDGRVEWNKDTEDWRRISKDLK